MNRDKLQSRAFSRHLRPTAWAGAGLAAVVLLGASCRSTGTPAGETEDYRLALGATASARTSDEGAINLGLTRFNELFADFRPEPVYERALELYSDHARFDDGFATLEGNAAIAEYLQRSAGHVDGLHVVIADSVVNDGEVYVRWEMRFASKDGGPTTEAPGISHLRFNDQSQVIYHRDYWDASGALADRVPAVGPFLRWIKSRI